MTNFTDDEVKKLHRELGQISAKLDNIYEHLKSQDDEYEKLDKRVVKLEGFKQWWLGLTAAVAGLAAFVTAFMKQLFLYGGFK